MSKDNKKVSMKPITKKTKKAPEQATKKMKKSKKISKEAVKKKIEELNKEIIKAKLSLFKSKIDFAERGKYHPETAEKFVKNGFVNNTNEFEALVNNSAGPELTQKFIDAGIILNKNAFKEMLVSLKNDAVELIEQHGANQGPLRSYYDLISTIYCCDSREISVHLGLKTAEVNRLKEIFWESHNDSEKKMLKLHNKEDIFFGGEEISKFDLDFWTSHCNPYSVLSTPHSKDIFKKYETEALNVCLQL